MNKTETAQCYALVCGAYDLHASDAGIAAWHMLLSRMDATVALEATRLLCERDTSFPPRPGEIIAEAKRLLGDNPPSVDAALSFYVTGNKAVHPLVRKAAERCYLNPARDSYDSARFEFRGAYEAVLHEAEDEARQESRMALGIETRRVELAKPKSVAAAIAEEQAERPKPGDGVPMPDEVRAQLDKLRRRQRSDSRSLDSDDGAA